MPANPITDQYLATIKTGLGGTCLPNCQGTDHVIIDRTIEALSTGLPDVDPTIVGEVMLHMAILLSELNTSSYAAHMPPANRARFIIDCGALAGAQLTTGIDFTRSAVS